jgi:hypothetical protein
MGNDAPFRREFPGSIRPGTAVCLQLTLHHAALRRTDWLERCR